MKRVPYHENRYWKYDAGEWYDDDPCSDWHADPEWYAPDLIRSIMDHHVDHKIACHTFSHIDCRDSVCSPSVLEDEITECRKHAQPYGIEMVSFIHPGHTIGNIATLKRLGFTSFRSDYHNVLGFPIRHPVGLWELRTSAELHYRRGWSTNYHIYRFCSIVDRGVKHRRLIYFWFHPSFSEVVVDRILEPIFAHIAALRDNSKLWVVNTKNYVNYLNSLYQDEQP